MCEANLDLSRRYWSHAKEAILIAQSNVSTCLEELGRLDEALVLTREVYTRRVAMFGVSNEDTLLSALNLIISYTRALRFAEAKKMILEQLPIANRVLGKDHQMTLAFQRNIVIGLLRDEKSTREDALQAEKIVKDMLVRLRRVYGPTHPDTRLMEEHWLCQAQEKLATYDSRA